MPLRVSLGSQHPGLSCHKENIVDKIVFTSHKLKMLLLYFQWKFWVEVRKLMESLQYKLIYMYKNRLRGVVLIF